MPVSTPADLSATFSGPLVTPADAEYEVLRRVHNGLIDRRPSLIARCRGVADIVAAVRFAHNAELPVAVRGGGHNVAGRATIDDGLLIDLSLMDAVFVDPRQRTARAQGGATWADFNRETQVFGLATTGGTVSSTGIAGLTLGGGLGWLHGKHGLAADNLRSIELVTARGEVVTASAGEHPDLFWALRGGGGNFGIAASFEYSLHPVGPTILGGAVLHPFSAAEEALRFYRDFTAGAPDELTVFFGCTHAPDGSGTKVAALVAAYAGPDEQAEPALAPLKTFGSPLADALGPISYAQLNAMFDGAMPRGARNYWKSTFLPRLTDDAIRTIVDAYAAVTSPMSVIFLEHLHGAATRVPIDATAFPLRRPGYNFLLLSQWTETGQDERHRAWARHWYDAMQPSAAGGRYGNYLDQDDVGDAAGAAFGPNYARLQAVKATWDPDNFFRQNLNIRPLRP